MGSQDVTECGYFNLNELKLTKQLCFSLAVRWVTTKSQVFQALSSHMQLVATVLDSAVIECFHCHRKFYWTVLLYRKGQQTSPIKEYVVYILAFAD